MIILNYRYKNIDEIKKMLQSSEDSYLRIANDSTITDFSFLIDYNNILKLEINKKIPINFINSMPELREVYGKECRLNCSITNKRIEVLKGIWSPKFSLSDNCTQLKLLGVTNCKNLEFLLDDIQKVECINTLEFGNLSVENFDGLPVQSNITSLTITKSKALKDLSGMSLLFPNLEYLKIEYVNLLTNYSELEKMTKLKTLIVFKSGNIPNLSFCKTMQNLRDIRIVSTIIEDKPDDDLINIFKSYDNVGFIEV